MTDHPQRPPWLDIIEDFSGDSLIERMGRYALWMEDGEQEMGVEIERLRSRRRELDAKLWFVEQERNELREALRLAETERDHWRHKAAGG